MEIKIIMLLIGAAIAALASPLPVIFSHAIKSIKKENLLLCAWEVSMLYFSAFGMTLLCGMVFMIVFAKLYMLWPPFGYIIPVIVALVALIDLESDASRGFGLKLFPIREERIKWYKLSADEHHPVTMGSLAAAGELFTSGALVLLIASHLAKLYGGTIFDQLLPLLLYTVVFTIIVALLSAWNSQREVTGQYRKWSMVLIIVIIAASVWIMFH